MTEPAPAPRSPRLTEARMWDRFVAEDAWYDGRFFVCVKTTGIYCLPSCRVRKPLRKNVGFAATAEEARARGFRACLKCRPDDFARGADPVLETVEALVAEVRAEPAAFRDAAALAARSGFGATRFAELLRRHYHATPADLLLRARLDRAERALAGGAPVSRAALDAGFEALSAFHDQFRKRNGMTPACYRRLGEKGTNLFTVALPSNYPVADLRRFLGRHPESLTERLEGDVYRAGVRFGGKPAFLTLRIGKAKVSATVSPAAAVEAHAFVRALLGLDRDPEPFVRLARRKGFGRLVKGREGLRITRTPSVFDGLVWSIVGQQVNLTFAAKLRHRLVELAGTPLRDGSGLHAPPTPEAVAALRPDDLTPLQFSRQKADYLLGAARLAASGKLDLDTLAALSATRAERTLLAVRGLGPWAVHYLMMRSLGFSDCVPLGDTGVTGGLRDLLKVDRPDVAATRRLMEPFSPYRSLATFHLWHYES